MFLREEYAAELMDAEAYEFFDVETGKFPWSWARIFLRHQ